MHRPEEAPPWSKPERSQRPGRMEPQVWEGQAKSSEQIRAG